MLQSLRVLLGARLGTGQPQAMPTGGAREEVQQQLVLAQHALLAVLDQRVEDAVALANDSEYGLNAAVWTGDIPLGEALAARLRCGTVNVNEAYAATWASVDSPMGGMKGSGMGRRHGIEGIMKYTESQTVATQRLLPVAPPPGLDVGWYARIMTAALTLLRRIPGLG